NHSLQHTGFISCIFNDLFSDIFTAHHKPLFTLKMDGIKASPSICYKILSSYCSRFGSLESSSSSASSSSGTYPTSSAADCEFLSVYSRNVWNVSLSSIAAL